MKTTSGTEKRQCVDCEREFEAAPRRGPSPTRCQECKKKLANKRSRESHKVTRTLRIEQGLCISCGIAPVMVVKKEPTETKQRGAKTKKYQMCENCYNVTRQRQIALYGERPKKEPKPPLSPEERQEKWRQYHKERRQRLLAQNPNLCTHCLKKDRMSGKTYCEKCSKQAIKFNNRRNRKRRKNNLCLICAKPTDGYQYCSDCRKEVKEYIHRRRHQKEGTTPQN